jgi:hypothetical protein
LHRRRRLWRDVNSLHGVEIGLVDRRRTERACTDIDLRGQVVHAVAARQSGNHSKARKKHDQLVHRPTVRFVGDGMLEGPHLLPPFMWTIDQFS